MKEWPPEQRKLAIEHRRARRSTRWIANEMGVTYEAMKQAFYRWDEPAPRSLLKESHRRPREPDDIATRLAYLEGLTFDAPTPRKHIDDATLLRYKGRGFDDDALMALEGRAAPFILGWPSMPEDALLDAQEAALARVAGLQAFASELCRLTLDPAQLAAAYLIHATKRSVCLFGRRVGKSMGLAAIALHDAVTIPKAEIIVCSAGSRQATEVSKAVLGLIAQSEEVFATVKTQPTLEAIPFTNRSVIRFLSATALIRGFGARSIYVDEARDILDEETTYSALEPMLATTDGNMAILSSPRGATGKLFDCWNSPLWGRARARTLDSVHDAEQIRRHVEGQRLRMSAAMFACEYEASFMEAVSAYFGPEALKRCVKEYDIACVAMPGKQYALGIDWAEVRDASVWTVASRNTDTGQFRIEWIKDYHGVEIPEQLPYATQLDGVFHFARIVTETKGLGTDASHRLRMQWPDRVQEFDPSIGSKALAFEYFKSVVERGGVDIPYYPQNLLAEMRTFEFEHVASGMKLHAPQGMSDDFVHSACYAILGLKEPEAAQSGMANAWPCPSCEGKGCYTCRGTGIHVFDF